jgi:hypothetical protein
MGFAGYVAERIFIALFFTVSLHVSAYMAIFKCVGNFIFICLKDSALLTVKTNIIKLHADRNITCKTHCFFTLLIYLRAFFIMNKYQEGNPVSVRSHAINLN